MDVGDPNDLVMDLIVSPAVTSHSSAILGITLCSVGSISGARLVQLAESPAKSDPHCCNRCLRSQLGADDNFYASLIYRDRLCVAQLSPVLGDPLGPFSR